MSQLVARVHATLARQRAKEATPGDQPAQQQHAAQTTPTGASAAAVVRTPSVVTASHVERPPAVDDQRRQTAESTRSNGGAAGAAPLASANGLIHASSVRSTGAGALLPAGAAASPRAAAFSVDPRDAEEEELLEHKYDEADADGEQQQQPEPLSGYGAEADEEDGEAFHPPPGSSPAAAIPAAAETQAQPPIAATSPAVDHSRFAPVRRPLSHGSASASPFFSLPGEIASRLPPHSGVLHPAAAEVRSDMVVSEREAMERQWSERSPTSLSEGLRQRQRLRSESDASMTSTPTVWMCVYHLPSSSLYGVSTFDLHSEVLHIGEFTEVAPIQELKMRIGPSQIVTNANAAEQLYDLLASNDVDPSHPFELITLKRQEFTTEAAIQRLRLVQFEDLASGMTTEEMKTMSKSDHALLLKSVLDFQRPSLLCALGGLIHHLLHTAIFAQLESDRMLAPVIVRSLQPLPTADLLKVDLLTRESLSIFVSESHPSAGGGPRGGGKAKEGYSVFAMVNHTKTPGGARMLREWMENPTKEREVILYRQDHVEYFTMDANSELVGFLRLHLRNVRDLPRLIARFSGPKSTAADWRTFKKGLRAVLEICRRVEGRRDELPLFHELHLLDPLQLEDLHDQIERTLDIADEPTRRTTTATAVGEEAQEASILTHRNSKIIHVKSSISSDLDALRQRYSDLDDELDRFTEDERGGMEATGGFVDQVVEHAIIVYMPQLGFMLQLPRLDDLSEDDSLRQTTACDQLGFEFKFHTGEMRYYKTPTTMELDANPGDIQSAIADKERMIILEVQEQVLQHRDLLRELSRKMEELDCYLSLALAALTHRLCRPTMTSSAVMDIRDGRHLLYAHRMGEKFVPNSTVLGSGHGQDAGSNGGSSAQSDASGDGGRGNIQIITGPNMSGKSVYLKQVGIIVYLAHTGSFVPAAAATIGVCDAILSKMRTPNAAGCNYSTFMYETSQMAYLLKHATSRSLCLIDEYGAGTSGPDGLALVANTLLHLARQSSPPKVLFTTHLHELASMQLVDESDQVSYWKMDFQTEARREEQAQHHQEESKTSESASESGSAGFSSDERPAQRQKISHSTSGEGSRSAQPPSGSSQSRSSSGSGAGCGGESTSSSSLHLSTPPSSSSSRLLPPLITCLHRLVPGVAHRSYGTSCAIAAGVPAVWMQRAEEVAEKMERKEEIAPIGGLTRGEVEEFSRFAAFVLHVSGYRSSSAPAASPSAPSSLSNSSTVASLLSDISSGRINLEAAFSHIAPERVSQLMEEYRKQLNGGGGSGQQSDNSSSSAIEEQRMME